VVLTIMMCVVVAVLSRRQSHGGDLRRAGARPQARLAVYTPPPEIWPKARCSSQPSSTRSIIARTLT
jgi:hypothetical protein